MEPSLLVHLTPEEQARWARCQDSDHPCWSTDLPATLTALASARAALTEARGAVERYGHHFSGCQLLRCARAHPHDEEVTKCGCDCGFDTARTGQEGR